MTLYEIMEEDNGHTSSTNEWGPIPSCIFQLKGVDLWRQHWDEHRKGAFANLSSTRMGHAEFYKERMEIIFKTKQKIAKWRIFRMENQSVWHRFLPPLGKMQGRRSEPTQGEREVKTELVM